MTANVMVAVEGQFDTAREQIFRAWVERNELSPGRGGPGWHVEDATAGERAPAAVTTTSRFATATRPPRVTTDAVGSEYFDPDVFVSRERINGGQGIDPDKPVELRVELTEYGRNGSLL